MMTGIANRKIKLMTGATKTTATIATSRPNIATSKVVNAEDAARIRSFSACSGIVPGNSTQPGASPWDKLPSAMQFKKSMPG